MKSDLTDPTAEALVAAGRRATAREAAADEECSEVYRQMARRGAEADRQRPAEPDQFTVSPTEAAEWLRIQDMDRTILEAKRAQYGASWKRRGGTGAYHVGIRHADRIEAIAERFGHDLWRCLAETPADGDESMLNAIGDLRRYLLLWEGHWRLMAAERAKTARVGA